MINPLDSTIMLPNTITTVGDGEAPLTILKPKSESKDSPNMKNNKGF